MSTVGVIVVAVGVVVVAVGVVVVAACWLVLVNVVCCRLVLG